MNLRAVLIAALALLSSAAAWSQAAKPDAPKAEAAKADSAEAAAAMERAQRMAANPMKVILQASKIRRRAGEPEVAVDVSRQPLRLVAATGTATPAAVATLSGAPAGTPQAAPEPVPPSAPIVTSLVLSPPPAAATPAETLPLERVGVAPVAGLVPPALPLPTTVTSLPLQPRLAKMVEPEIPPRLRSENQRVGEVSADLTLRADGSVAAVALLPPVPRSWQRYLVAALEQWRFDALPAEQVHRVQLVFDAP